MRTALILVVLVALAVGAFWWLSPFTIHYQPTTEVATSTTPAELAPIELVEHTVTLPDGTEGTFRIAAPFAVTVAAEGLGKARFMAMSPDGRLFVPDLVDYQLSHEGRLFVLDDFNEETGQFETTHTYLSGLRGPNSVAFYTDEEGQHWLYLALTAHLLRYPYQPGDTEPSGEPEVLIAFPNTQTPGETSVVWHITRTLLFAGDRLYIAIGSGCNACEQPEEELRGLIMSMDPDGGNVEVYANGLRNAVGIEWASGALYATANGVDHLGTEAPDETMYRIEHGTHYGWPYCYELDGERIADGGPWERGFPCEDAPHSFAAFAPRSAPLGLAYFSNIHPVLDTSFLVALHGSFEPETRSGYEVVRVSSDGEQETFMDGFQRADGTRIGRPVDLLPYDEDSFFMTDDFSGRVYYLRED